jgi:hypothetical protein
VYISHVCYVQEVRQGLSWSLPLPGLPQVTQAGDVKILDFGHAQVGQQVEASRCRASYGLPRSF